MPLLELDLNENTMDFNEDLDGGFNQNMSTSILQVSSSSIPFDSNGEVFMEDNTQSPAHLEPHISSSSDIEEDIIDDVTNLEVAETTKNKNLCNEDRRAIYNHLLDKSVEGKLKRGELSMVALQFSVSERTVYRIWKQGKNNVHDVSHKRTKNCGRKRIEIELAQVRDIPLRQRTTIRSLSCAMNMSKSTLHRSLKSGVIRRHSSAIKPFLKEENKRARLQFCISMLDWASLPHDPIFSRMYNTIHIDEKWFYMTKKSENYYLLQDEEDPIRTCKSKSFIEKVMFLVAIARPRFDAQQNEVFSGKIGVFPLVTQEPAKRTSVNRVAGTLETKPITSVTKQVIRTFLIEKVLPAIKEKWPREEIGCPIFIQQDNARTHIDCDDDEFCQVASRDGFDIRLMCQPANSPDLNILDLGYFSAIQSLQHKESPSSIDDLVKAVEKSFETFSVVKSNRIFLTLQLCMIEIMKARGSNKYKISHLGKERLERQGKLPTRLKCDPTLVQDVLKYLE